MFVVAGVVYVVWYNTTLHPLSRPQWHSLDRAEQAKYYEKARKEKEQHQEMFPGWSARDNYGTHSKKKKRKKPCSESENSHVPAGMSY